jgi:hypothetical protein
MGVLEIGFLYLGAALLLLFSGMPIAFALGGTALAFMYFFMPANNLENIAETLYSGTQQLHAADDPAVHPDGRGDRQDARRRRPLRGGAPLALQAARQPRRGQRLRLLGVRRDVRLQPGHLRRDRRHGHPRDAQARLFRRARLGPHRRRRHAGHPDPALADADHLRHHHRAVDRQAVHRRGDPRHPAGRDLRVVGDVRRSDARSRRRRAPARRQANCCEGRVLHLAPAHGNPAAPAALRRAHRGGDGRALRRLGHALGGGGRRRRRFAGDW